MSELITPVFIGLAVSVVTVIILEFLKALILKE